MKREKMFGRKFRRDLSSDSPLTAASASFLKE